jgi:hypothetical protein
MSSAPAMRALLVGMTLLLAVGCSRKPSAADIEGQLGRDIAGCENLHIKDVKKVNGYEDGSNRYVAEVTYAIEFTKLRDEFDPELTVDEKVQRAQCLLAELPLKMAAIGHGDGSRALIHQDIVLRRTEAGWRIVETTDR